MVLGQFSIFGAVEEILSREFAQMIAD